MHTAIIHQRDGLSHFIRLDVFHPLLETALQKNLQAYFSVSAWGILRQHCGFSEAFLPWVQAVGNMLGFAILVPSAIPGGCSPASPQQLHSLLTNELCESNPNCTEGDRPPPTGGGDPPGHLLDALSSIVLVVNITSDVLQVVHVCPDQHVPQLHKVTVCLVFHCGSSNRTVLGHHTLPGLSREPLLSSWTHRLD